MKMKFLGGVLLVSGTTIGAGMLALPVVTGFAGFLPTMLLFLLFWIYMTFTAFLMLEVNLWMGEHSNLVTMAKKTLGTWGELFSWIVYLFLLYTLTTAYMAGSGPIFLDFFHSISGQTLPGWMGPFPLLVIFSFFVYKGAKSVDSINRILMIGLILSYILMIFFLSSDINVEKLAHVQWSAIWIAVPIVSTSFGFHVIIPTLTDYLERDVKSIRWVLLIGSFIPLVVYSIWEMVALGIIPIKGPEGFIDGYQKGLDGATLLSLLLKRSDLSLLARCFSLFAIVTSFLGVSLSLRDFLADGFKIEKSPKGRCILYLLTFTPPLVLTLTDPRAFLHALEYAGVFGVVTLLGLLPVLMVWKGRKEHQNAKTFTVPGGQWALVIALIISFSIIGLEIANKSGLLSFNKIMLQTSE